MQKDTLAEGDEGGRDLGAWNCVSQDYITNLGNNQRMLIIFREDFIAEIKKITPIDTIYFVFK